MIRFILSLTLLFLLTACAEDPPTPDYLGQWNIPDFAVAYRDVQASRAEARVFRARAATRHYAAPGPQDDLWGAYVQEAATRFHIPARWIREVMWRESGGRLRDAHGAPITSWAGAMGLMQVMPGTYDILRRRYALGPDPYEPHDNIMAGAAYIREMYDRYGAPDFLAAYNAGPDRVDAYKAGTPLPAETVAYMAGIAPRLGMDSPGPQLASITSPESRAETAPRMIRIMTPYRSAVYATRAPQVIFASARMPVSRLPVASMPAPPDRQPEQEVAELPSPMAAPVPPPAPAISGDWGIRLASYPDAETTRVALQSARAAMTGPIASLPPTIEPISTRTGTAYRAQLLGLSADAAVTTCDALLRRNLTCVAVPPGS